RHFDVLAPRNAPYYRHVLEGDDDMPAHIKSVLIGTDLTIPIRHGELALGIWQGIYLAEHRDHAGPRSIVATLQGTERI
ncbi:MAG: secondary thiamine-phosphate synthase enzyme, partial [Glaciecola sp.]